MFNKSQTRNLKIVLVFLFVISLSGYVLSRYSVQEYKGRGFAAIDSEYVEPKLYHDFVNDEEIRHLLDIAEPLFTKSTVINSKAGAGHLDESVRQSETAWLPKNDPVVKSVIERASELTKIPFKNAEKIQLLRYTPGGFYSPHHDSSCGDGEVAFKFEKRGGQRVATVVMYLNDDFTGGETVFPNLNKTFKPIKNSALLFYSLEKNGNKCHPLSLHGGNPVETGQKYIANVWLREREMK
ncbi:MAG: hypothetical protein CMF46_00125 [Legionellales bacterium]|nr:hypothetical protein [Legionellales bacterium]|tara:strand:- start:341 stop:1057 length:717 start_codon:yes stop_codon:yes gene_type:complete